MALICTIYHGRDITYHYHFLCLSETLYPRSPEALEIPQRTWRQNMMLRGKVHPNRNFKPVGFIRPLQILKYPIVLFPALYFSVSFCIQ
jgi:hypothetical protein